MSTEQAAIDVESTSTHPDPRQPSQAVAIRQPDQGGAVGPVRAPIGQQESFESLMTLAKELCSTGFLPAAVKTPAQAVAIILTGRELGLPPMQALRSICIIQGKPELAADLQLSIFHRDGGRSKWVALTEAKAVLWLRHPNGDEHTEDFTMEDARRAGLAGGQNWQKYPKAMLRSRAITAGLKSIGFEPLTGAYAPGEIGGPEIVGPEPETVPEQRQEAPRAPSNPPASQRVTHTPPPSAAPTAAAKAPVPAPTEESRAKMITLLEANPGKPNREIVTEYFIKAEILMPNESLEDVPLRWVPATTSQMRALSSMITAFSNGEQFAKPYPPNEEPLPPKQPKAAPSPKPATSAASGPASAPSTSPASNSSAQRADPEWFFDIIVPIPRKGMKRDEYLKNPDTIGSLYEMRHGNDEEAKAARTRLWGFLKGGEETDWTPQAREYNGKTYQPSESDKAFYRALKEFSLWRERNHPEEKL